ncbi:DUF2970 domain-containing protein [Oceanimonas doudoroffii]|uniref:DUF2970 domain-containing protein n=1 Tax=Oceanimonas doudoroffii TaxID=84158 RepID=A0A233RJB9_9GAMM|nr:DUF2970 domain-containing protein [Oceanimonas doudoroffii]OXY83483.1 hypothetical protein B6S08_08360 [Oceanimonas doudoroffii]
MNWKYRLQGVLAAMFGVQSEQHRRAQFSGSPWPYVAMGVVVIVLFVLALLGVVQLVLGA